MDRMRHETEDQDLALSSSGSAGGISGSSAHSTSEIDSTAGGAASELTVECPVTRQRNQVVNRSKTLVYLSLLSAAVVVGSLTFVFTRKREEYKFRATFRGRSESANKVVEATTARLFGQVGLLGVTLTSHSLANDPFPNVTIARFGRRSQDARNLSAADLILLAPIVRSSRLPEWEEYANESQSWVYEDWRFSRNELPFSENPGNITPQVYSYETLWATIGGGSLETNGSVMASERVGSSSPFIDEPFHVPIWEMGPVPRNASLVNFDLYTHPTIRSTIDKVLEVNHTILSGTTDLALLTDLAGITRRIANGPSSYLIHPIKEDFFPGSPPVAFLFTIIQWEEFFRNLVPPGTNGILIEIQGSCGDVFSFLLEGPESIYLGPEAYHDDKYDNTKYEYQFAREAQYDGENVNSQSGYCHYNMTVYPTAVFEQTFYTNMPAVYCGLVVIVFFVTTLIFMAYDYMVHRRQEKLLFTAQRTKTIVASLFPKEIHDRILANTESGAETDESKWRPFSTATKAQIKHFLKDDEKSKSDESLSLKSKPIAELFPHATVMFADLVGFTAWSSTREPAHVFTLLETIYFEFDQIAIRRRVFKVETIGDCYVAVCGLPDHRKDHATAMSRFAHDCLCRMSGITKLLELKLGPDTNELGLRIGLHSGPVTAGVLRGERARFQLFGDTVNTTARIESTGAKNKIHVSAETAELLQLAGKGHWTKLRQEKIHALGKGDLQTYWLELDSGLTGSCQLAESGKGETNSAGEQNLEEDSHTWKEAPHDQNDVIGHSQPLSPKTIRLANWNVDILSRLLREHVARREASGREFEAMTSLRALELGTMDQATIPIDEVKDVIELPPFDSEVSKRQLDPSDIDLGETVQSQLVDYVQTMAALYRDNAFHNFEHASHVTMSVVKLLSRIVAPDIKTTNRDALHKDLHDHTFGITSDPLTQFGVVLAALVHDVDHTGVPNSQLVKEHASIAVVYKEKSVAEQNSFDIAWDVLMQDSFEDLRKVIYTTTEEFRRFRQLLVNAIMATDIMDKELNAIRKARWNVAFDECQEDCLLREKEVIGRKATIVIEHLIQASDVAHTMQHWLIFIKWNTRLFEEMYKAYIDGRSTIDPSEHWYNGEISFFDYYIIPLAKKLKDCGVFGVSSDEYLTYAHHNRREWEAKGQAIVAEMAETMKAQYSRHRIN